MIAQSVLKSLIDTCISDDDTLSNTVPHPLSPRLLRLLTGCVRAHIPHGGAASAAGEAAKHRRTLHAGGVESVCCSGVADARGLRSGASVRARADASHALLAGK